MHPLTKFKNEFKTNGPFTHLNNAGLAPVSNTVRKLATAWIDRFYEDGANCFLAILQGIEETRGELATLLGAPVGNVALFSSTSGALSQIALGFPLDKDDEIIVWDQEYPSNFYPWKVAAERSGARLVIAKSGLSLETPAQALIDLITPKTKIIAFSWVQYRSGATTDLNTVTSAARARGIFTCADIIQGAGVLPFDFRRSGLDAACGGSHKWLAGLSCTGFLLLRDEHITKLKPTNIGAMSFGNWDDLANPHATLKKDCSRFEPGAKSFVEVISLSAALKLLRETGIAQIAAEAQRLTSFLAEGLADLGYKINSPHGETHRGAIVNFSPTANSRIQTFPEIEAQLQAKKISYAKRPPGIRLSPHAFNHDEDIEKVINALSC